ncbi:hypothetical protein BS47DRAFT_1410215 [Hydnum rufescens UP504]|uniref:Uncharacterized protein n=1 Tax=Hydnum rufescens UP504 TaxID=1448309 RepID=A0A9P6AQ36_9AGAM|nr:hypothetical protein BS47DRAFT_1410215 [Hydnum rufescens UP504]
MASCESAVRGQQLLHMTHNRAGISLRWRQRLTTRVLPSRPKLVYRTGTTPWTKPTGLEAYTVLKELRPVFGHSSTTSGKTLGPEVYSFLDSVGVLWTTIDVVRFVKVGKGEAVGPVVLWIGVTPETLFGESARAAAYSCRDLLEKFGITDVEVEFRESIYTRLAGPSLLKPVSDIDPTADVCSPLTPALGPYIAAQATPHTEGTGGFYLAEGGNSKKVLLVTARHVLFPQNEGPNIDYAWTNTSAPRRNVLLLGTQAFNNLIESIKIKTRGHGLMAVHYNQEIEELQKREAGKDEDDAKKATMDRKQIEWLLDEANEAMEALTSHIVHSPPLTLGAGKERFTEDYAVVELDSSKIEKAFRGNVIDLGMKIPFPEFTSKMCPCADATTTFQYPDDRLLELRDLIQENEMSNPDMLGPDGRATGIFSFVREYFNNGTHQTSMEWAILPYDHKSGDFSAPGDSGSIIVDGQGRFGGLLTGGAGKRDSLDITYATPLFWLLPRIKANGFPDAHLYPAMA